MDRYTLLIDNAMISDKKGGWVHYKDAAARISELEAQLSAAHERKKWIPISDGPPKEARPVLVVAQNKKGEVFVLRAAYAHKHELELSEDQDDEFGEYDEVSDIYYCPEGWYEWNYTDETHYYLSGLTVTHWREKPAPPKEEALDEKEI